MIDIILHSIKCSFSYQFLCPNSPNRFYILMPEGLPQYLNPFLERRTVRNIEDIFSAHLCVSLFSINADLFLLVTVEDPIRSECLSERWKASIT